MSRVQRTVVRSLRRMPGRALRKIAGPPWVIDGQKLDLHIHAVAALAAKQADPDAELTPETARKGMRTLAAMGAADPIDSVAIQDRTIAGPGGPLPVRVYRPTSVSGDAPAVVWYHQGGGVIGDLDTDHSLCTRLAADAGAVVVSVDYRLGPEHRFPAGVDDALAGYRWVLDQADGLGVDPARVAVAGTSQGGTYAAVVCQEMRRRGEPQPLAQIMLYPGVDQVADSHSMESCAHTFPLTRAMLEFFAANYLPDLSAGSDVKASPAQATELWGLAPALVVTAGFDPLRDQGNAYASALESAGVSVIHRCEHPLSHSFTLFDGVSPVAAEAVARITADVAELLALPPDDG